jgi:predicted component of type VI protein secretion system
MIDDRNTRPSSDDAERDRVARDMAGRLFTRGVDVRDDDSNDDVTAIEEAVERFESRVQAGGGDLMVDEPPRGREGEPDQARFRLPLRQADESATRYIERLERAADELRGRPAEP